MIAARVAAACILILGLTFFMVRSLGQGAQRPAIEGTIESCPFAVISPMGGEVAEILVHVGERVRPAQLLVRLKPLDSTGQLERSLAAINRLPPNFLQTAAGMLDRVRPHTWAELTATDPELRVAEQEYVDALAAAQPDRIRTAARRREAAYRKRALLGPDALQTAKSLLRDSSSNVELLNKLQDSSRLVASEAGTVEILDLHHGEIIPPLGRVALLTATNRWRVRAHLPDEAIASFPPGKQVALLLSSGRKISANIENVTLGELTAVSTDAALQAQTGNRVRILE
jgi:multidrug efflux pump subunit AcrA (membrane-fusion protein)